MKSASGCVYGAKVMWARALNVRTIKRCLPLNALRGVRDSSEH